MAGDDTGDDVGEVSLRVDCVELSGFDQQGDRRPVLSAAVGTREERILPVQSDRPDGALDDVVVDLDAAAVEEARKARPARERVADRFRQLALLTDESELPAEPGLKRRDDRPAPLLAGGATFVRTAAADFAFDAVEFGDALERLRGDGRRSAVNVL